MEDNKQNSQKKPTIKDRLEKLNNIGKNAVRVGIATAVLGTIGGIGYLYKQWNKSPEEVEKDANKIIPKVEQAAGKRVEDTLGTNKVAKTFGGWGGKIAVFGGEVAKRLHTEAARRNQEEK